MQHNIESKKLNQSKARFAVHLIDFLISFSKEKDKDVEAETHRIKKQLDDEIDNRSTFIKEIESLKCQLAESEDGLLAAARISDQLEIAQVNNAALKEEREIFVNFFKHKCKAPIFNKFFALLNTTRSKIVKRVERVELYLSYIFFLDSLTQFN